MIEVKVKWIETAILKTDVKRLLKGIKSWMQKSLIYLHWIAVKNTPIDTWVLKKWYRERYSGLRGKMFNRTAYARYVDGGTKYIKPRNFLETIKDKSEERIDTILNSEISKQIW